MADKETDMSVEMVIRLCLNFATYLQSKQKEINSLLEALFINS